MSVLNLKMLGGAAAGSAGFSTTNSHVFENSSAQFLNQTLSTPSDSNQWTFSTWIKRTDLASTQYIFSTSNAHIGFTSSDQIDIVGGATTFRVTSGVYRDTSDYMNIVVIYDSDDATAADRIKLFVDGVQVTNFGTSNNPTSAADLGTFNTAVSHTLGIDAADNSSNRLDGYMSDTVFVDDQVLTETDFGAFDANGKWVPIDVSTLTFGNNGFYLDGATLGVDVSGNTNHFTNNSTSLSDDNPNENFLILNDNEANTSLTLSGGNLVMTGGASHQKAIGTIGLPNSGKFYVEAVVTTTTSASVAASIGICDMGRPANLSATTQFTDGIMMYASNAGNVDEDASNLFTGFTFTAGDVLQMAIDLDDDKMWFGINDNYFDSAGGTTGNPATGANAVSTTSWKGYMVAFGLFSNTLTIQADSNSFTHTPPSGFSALQASNLPTSISAGDHHSTVTYTATGSSLAVTGVGFQPDLHVNKCRNDIEQFDWIDNVRGVTKLLHSDGANIETTDATALTSFDTDGFTLGTSTRMNNSGTGSYVGWNWKADNTSGSSNSDGTITSTVSANTDAGFSIVTYTGNGTGGATVGHGLGVAPDMIIVKNRDQADSWQVFHSALGATKSMQINSTSGASTSSTFWNDTAPSSTVFSLGTAVGVNTNTEDYVAYCFANVEGYSDFSSFVGNGSASGPFVYTGFKPAFVMVRSSTAAAGWRILDVVRDPFNAAGETLSANSNAAEAAETPVLDFLSNGFRIRWSDSVVNGSGATIIYAAFAEYPFFR